MNKRELLLPTLSRTSPLLFLILILFNCILYPSYESFYLFISYILACISNNIFKTISKIIYNLFNIKSIPILGSGSRPTNAHSCSLILDNSISQSYGMPSGHSQTAWTFATFFLLKIIQNWYNKYKNKYKNKNKNTNIIDYIWLIISCSLILSSAIYISYSRVYIEGCHTLQQVIVGGLIGIVSGFIIYYFENYGINLLQKFY